MKKTIAVVLMCAVAMASGFATAGITVKLSASPIMLTQEGLVTNFERGEVYIPITLDLQYELTDSFRLGFGLSFSSMFTESPSIAASTTYCATAEYELPICSCFSAQGQLGMGFGAFDLSRVFIASATLSAKFGITDSLAVELGYSAIFGTAFSEVDTGLLHYPQLGVSYSF